MSKKKISNIYDNYITYENINKMWNIVRKTCKNKRGIYRFSKNKNTNIYNIIEALKNGKYVPFPYRIFMIFEPKSRIVMSQDPQDKIVNHFVANYYLIPYLEKKLIDSNVATRKNKGSSYACKLIEKYLHEIKMKNPKEEIYVLKMDISKYFYTINHQILLSFLRKDIKDERVIHLIEMIISETNKPYVNEMIDKLNSFNGTNIPYYSKDVGLSIGAMTSQFFAIYYLNDLDHFIKEKLKCKYYIRYMDDFLFFDVDLKFLKNVWNIVANKLNDLKLIVNPKSNIFRMSNGISFVGYNYKIINDKLTINYNKKTIKRIRRKLKNLSQFDEVKYYRSYASYYGYLRKIHYIERNFVMDSNDKYQFYKKTNPKRIVFLREGKFYRTYENDAIIIWYIFRYKWNKNSICFGDSASIKVFDLLKDKSIGYYIASDDNIVVNGNDKVYDMYNELSCFNYECNNRKKEIYQLVNELLNEKDENYNLIMEFLKKIKN